MKVSKLLGERSKFVNSEFVVESHALMVRGGYIKNMCSGIFSYFTPCVKIIKKIENIIREEMDKIDGQEVKFPVVMPATLWQESGRYNSIGLEMARFKDHNNTEMVLGMTHEEAAVHMAKETAKSYSDFPFMIYQIQTKFRDELRPRAGLMRVKEFTMKDAYSFHVSQEDLNNYFKLCDNAYKNIYKRVGLSEVVSVESDSGMMGGSISREFMLLSEIGEDSIILCKNCDYKSNIEAGECLVKNEILKENKELELVFTPEKTSLKDVCEFLNTSLENAVKAVVYQRNDNNEFFVVFIRGDLEINEIKLKKYLQCDFKPGDKNLNNELCFGYIGPYNLNENINYMIDKSLENSGNLICGANKEDFHYKNFNFSLLKKDIEFIDVAEINENCLCPKCKKKSLKIAKSIELGHIFQLGKKYTKSMGMTYMDKDGIRKFPIMGCYGIGIGRLLASICEVNRDEFGPIWPISVAPWQVEICALRSDDLKIKIISEILYKNLLKNNIEVLYDDRIISTGNMFADADLLGVPVRVVVSPRNLKDNLIEISTRNKKIKRFTSVENALEEIKEILKILEV